MKINYNLLVISLATYSFFLFSIILDLFFLKNINLERDIIFFQTEIPRIKIFDNDIGVSCDGHALVRFVEKYSTIQPINVQQWVPMVDNQFNQNNEINSKLFAPNFFKSKNISFQKEEVCNLWISNRKGIHFDDTYKTKQLSTEKFYIGKSIEYPQLNDLQIKYKCMMIPEIKGFFLSETAYPQLKKFISKYITTNLNVDLKKLLKDEIKVKFYGAVNILSISFLLIILNNLNLISLNEKKKYLIPIIKKIYDYKIFILLPLFFIKESYLISTIIFNMIFLYVGLFFISRRP